MDFHIIPECFVDTNLIETIAPPTDKKQGYNHGKGCSTVAKKMLEEKALKEGFAVGIIDKDKKEIRYLLEFDEIIEKDYLKLFKHPKKHHYFIQIMPVVEKWILRNAEEVDVTLSDFNLPNELEQLKIITKKRTSREDPNLKNLFKELKRKEARGVMTLSKWVTYLKEENYKVDSAFFKK
jgi:hypothetical protein